MDSWIYILFYRLQPNTTVNLCYLSKSSSVSHWKCFQVGSCDLSTCPHPFLSTSLLSGFPHSSVGKESTCNAGDPGLIPGLGRSPGEGNSYQLEYSGLENSMDCIVHGVAKNWTRLSDFHFTREEVMMSQ